MAERRWLERWVVVMVDGVVVVTVVSPAVVATLDISLD